MAMTTEGSTAAPALHLQTPPVRGLARRSLQASLTTETLYRAPPTTIPQPPSQDGGNGGTIPIAAIAGGAAAGALFAIVVVIGWVWWGRQIKRDAAVQRMEAVSAMFYSLTKMGSDLHISHRQRDAIHCRTRARGRPRGG